MIFIRVLDYSIYRPFNHKISKHGQHWCRGRSSPCWKSFQTLSHLWKALENFSKKYESSYSCVTRNFWQRSLDWMLRLMSALFIRWNFVTVVITSRTQLIHLNGRNTLQEWLTIALSVLKKKKRKKGEEEKRKGNEEVVWRDLFERVSESNSPKRLAKSLLTCNRFVTHNLRRILNTPSGRKNNLFCTECDRVLDKPGETKCMHYVCAKCFIENVDKCQPQTVPQCPVCNTPIQSEDDLNTPPDVYVHLIGTGHDFCCKKCNEVMPYENWVSHKCSPNSCCKDPTKPRTIADAFKELQEGIISPDTAQLGNQYVRNRLKESLDGKTARLTGPGKVKLCYFYKYKEILICFIFWFCTFSKPDHYFILSYTATGCEACSPSVPKGNF